MRSALFMLTLIAACGNGDTYLDPVRVAVPIGVPPCRMQRADDGWYDTELQTPCEVARLNGKTCCLPAGMWEEVGTVYAEPTCAKLYNWAKSNGAPCLSGQSPFVLSTVPHAGQPQTCGDFTGIIWAGKPTLFTRFYDADHNCSDFGIGIDLAVSRVFEFDDPPILLTEVDFVNPDDELDCMK